MSKILELTKNPAILKIWLKSTRKNANRGSNTNSNFHGFQNISKKKKVCPSPEFLSFSAERDRTVGGKLVSGFGGGGGTECRTPRRHQHLFSLLIFNFTHFCQAHSAR